jgi:hypothetical protein
VFVLIPFISDVVRKLLLKLSLRLALNAVGLKNWKIPEIIFTNQYITQKEYTVYRHIIVTSMQIELHEYSQDPREPSHKIYKFESLEAFVRSYVTDLMGFTPPLKSILGEYMEMINNRNYNFTKYFENKKKLENEFHQSIDSYLNGFRFTLIAKIFKLVVK